MSGPDVVVSGPDVVVVGGGLAGISAAIDLADAGASVTLLEARSRLGGATFSFSRDGRAIDNGQHVFLRCCTEYREFLARLGVSESVRIQDRFDLTVLAPGREPARLRRDRLPAPLHLARALVGYSHLSVAERLGVIRAAAAMRLLRASAGHLPVPEAPTDDAPARGASARGASARGASARNLGQWLAARGQGETARRRLWDLFIVSALNVAGDDADLELAATVLQTGLLRHADAADIGVPVVPLSELHDRPAARLLARLGVRVRTGAKVRAVTVQDGRYRIDLGGSGGQVESAGVVLAAPAAVTAGLAGPLEPAAADWVRLGTSPIINVGVCYDRPVTPLPFAAAVDSPVQWVFDKTRVAGLDQGQYLAVSLSAADSYIDMPATRIREIFLPALAELFPQAVRATVTDFFVTRERRATFRQVPGCGRLRPGPITSTPGLVLAGSWTDTGWPDTMEGAVRSGRSAARALLGHLAHGCVPESAARALQTLELQGVRR